MIFVLFLTDLCKNNCTVHSWTIEVKKRVNHYKGLRLKTQHLRRFSLLAIPMKLIITHDDVIFMKIISNMNSSVCESNFPFYKCTTWTTYHKTNTNIGGNAENWSRANRKIYTYAWIYDLSHFFFSCTDLYCFCTDPSILWLYILFWFKHRIEQSVCHPNGYIFWFVFSVALEYNFLGHFPTARYICPEVVLKYPIEMKKRKIVSWLVHNFSKRALVSTLSTTAQTCFFVFFTKLKNKTFWFYHCG